MRARPEQPTDWDEGADRVTPFHGAKVALLIGDAPPHHAQGTHPHHPPSRTSGDLPGRRARGRRDARARPPAGDTRGGRLDLAGGRVALGPGLPSATLPGSGSWLLAARLPAGAEADVAMGDEGRVAAGAAGSLRDDGEGGAVPPGPRRGVAGPLAPRPGRARVGRGARDARAGLGADRPRDDRHGGAERNLGNGVMGRGDSPDPDRALDDPRLFLGVRVVPQSEKFVVERFGRLRSVLGPGINFIVPFLDRVAHKISILERQLPTAHQDAITTDNVLVKVETRVFYRITEPEKTVYRIRDVDAAIATTVAGIVRSEIGKMELDQVQSQPLVLISEDPAAVQTMVDDWGIEVTRAEILDVKLDEATRQRCCSS